MQPSSVIGDFAPVAGRLLVPSSEVDRVQLRGRDELMAELASASR